MKPQCIQAVAAAFGRDPSPAEIRKVEQNLARAMRAEAALDPDAWLALPLDQQLVRAAERAAGDLEAEASKQAQRRALQVLATARVQQHVDAFPGTAMEALARMIAFHADAKGSQLSIETQAKAIERTALGRMIDTLEATSPRFFGLFEDRAGIRDLVRELHGEATGNKDAATGAKVFRETAEGLRQRFNAAGGDVGRLDDWGMPHHHSQLLVAKAGREAWMADVLPRLNRARYVREDGSPMTDAEVREFLGEAWVSIATGGANKIEPGQFTGRSLRARRGDQARQIHFKSADDYLDYQAKFGERPVYDVLLGHIHSISRDIGLVEVFGPNPDQTFRLFRDRAVQTMTEATPTRAGKINKQAMRTEALYNLLAGKTEPIASYFWANFFDGLRNLQVASKLGSASITAITDEGTMRVAAHVNNLPQMQLLRNELAAFNPANRQERRLALRAGLALNTLAQSLNRFGNETLGSGWSSKLATTTIRASGLAASTDARRRAYGVTFMHALGQVVTDAPTLAALDAGDHRILLSKGITEADFAVWKRATLEDWGGGNDTMLTPEAIYRIPDEALADLVGNPQRLREQAATRLLGVVLEETDVAVIEPGIRERAMMGQGRGRGTLTGELTRSLFLFKSFPLSMLTRHWARALSMPTGTGRAAYLASLLASTTVLGMAALQASQVVTGRDPRDMTEWKTWISALLKGGALSLFGDFLFDDRTQYGQSVLATAAGPVAGLAEDAIALTIGNVHEAARGEDTHAGAEAARFAKENMPGANLWYTRAAIDHLVFHELQEFLSPGYLRKVRRRAQREFDTTYWWEPGQPLPERAPDLDKATGD